MSLRENGFVVGIMIIIILLVIGAVFIDRIVPSPALPNSSVVIDKSLAKWENGTSPSANVTLVIFGDYECPSTRSNWPMIQNIRSSYKDRLNFVFIHSPSDIHPHAQLAAAAAVCAKDKFWEYSDVAFGNPGLEFSDLAQYAGQVGKSESEFSKCVRSEDAKAKVEDDALTAIAHSVKGTPTYFINGLRYEGAQEETQFRIVIDSALRSIEG